MPASPSIPTPTTFVKWKETAELFSDDARSTETFVYDGPVPGIRHGWGRTLEGFWFFIAMTPLEELEFWSIYLEWRRRMGTGQHAFLAAQAGTRPPTCGTPNTPPCVVLSPTRSPLASVEPIANVGG